jgi:hypothetical protein
MIDAWDQYPGVIKALNKDSTVHVVFDDGEEVVPINCRNCASPTQQRQQQPKRKQASKSKIE